MNLQHNLALRIILEKVPKKAHENMKQICAVLILFIVLAHLPGKAFGEESGGSQAAAPFLEISEFKCYYGADSGFPIPHILCRNIAGFEPRLLSKEVAIAEWSIESLEQAVSTVLPMHYVGYSGRALIAGDQTALAFLETPLPVIEPEVGLTLIEALNRRVDSLGLAIDPSTLWEIRRTGPQLGVTTRATFYDTGAAMSLEGFLEFLIGQSAQLGIYLQYLHFSEWETSPKTGLAHPDLLPENFSHGSFSRFCRIIVAERGFYMDYEDPEFAGLFRALPHLNHEEKSAFRTDPNSFIASIAVSPDEEEYRRAIRLSESVPWLPTSPWHYDGAVGAEFLRLIGLMTPRLREKHWIADGDLQKFDEVFALDPESVTPFESATASLFLSRGGHFLRSVNWASRVVATEANVSSDSLVESTTALVLSARAANRPDLEAVFLDALRDGEAHRADPAKWNALLTAAEELKASFQPAE